ncbi:hypothetical protein BDW67DRAFT_160081 [Aspergillus spinulosporus]
MPLRTSVVRQSLLRRSFITVIFLTKFFSFSFLSNSRCKTTEVVQKTPKIENSIAPPSLRSPHRTLLESKSSSQSDYYLWQHMRCNLDNQSKTRSHKSDAPLHFRAGE